VFHMEQYMTSLEKLEMDIQELKARNARVEASKAWETSTARKILIMVLTYLVVVIFFESARIPRPWVNAVVPALAYMLSTLSVPIARRAWLHRRRHTR